MRYPGYQCFKTDNRTVYCSLNKVKDHEEASEWLRAACDNFDLEVDRICGEPYTSTRQPFDAIVWPYGPTICRIWSA
jgi:hypothetical protein